jgi:hypothetical protein
MMDYLKVHYPMKDVVWGLRRLQVWERRAEEYPFYTIGKSAYLDGDTPEYHDNINRLNGKMRSCFPALYLSILTSLTRYMMEEVHLDDSLAYPGFHIFENCTAFQEMAGNWHKDLPHETLGLGHDTAMAWTLAVQMPEGGGGIDFKDDETASWHVNKGYVPHDVGYLAIHDGMEPHRIASFKEKGSLSRITMQGHIIRRKDGPYKDKLVTFW